MQIALNTGGKSFFDKYLKLADTSEEKLTFNEFFFPENFSEVARKEADAVMPVLLHFGNEQDAARSDLLSERSKRLSEIAFDFVPFNALSMLFPHAHRIPRLFCRKIYERYRLRKRSLPAFEHFFDFFAFFQPKTAFRHFLYAETCFLPLFLRRLITFLPPVVFMRLRKP